MKEGARAALDQAGLKLDDIDAFDLYSCFPSIVEIMLNELDVPTDDPRSFTLTGGLPYFGGPWSNYSMHAIVSAVELIRVEYDVAEAQRRIIRAGLPELLADRLRSGT